MTTNESQHGSYKYLAGVLRRAGYSDEFIDELLLALEEKPSRKQLCDEIVYLISDVLREADISPQDRLQVSIQGVEVRR
jgi:hypothetical protein